MGRALGAGPGEWRQVMRALALGGAGAGALALAGMARAADADTGADTGADAAHPPAAPVVEEGNAILVTATKREQTLQDVPVAVTVTTGATLHDAQIRDLLDLTSVVPSLQVVQEQSSTQMYFSIRGFGNGANNAGIEPSVGVFVDGVYRSRSVSQIADFPDVARVEVLRGPQSTLFGKNASAGVISIVTDLPKFTLGGSAELSYGNYNALVAKATLTGPITDTLAFSLAGGFNRRDGYQHDAATGADINNRNRGFVRGQLLYDPASGPRVRLIADWGQIDELCCAVTNLRASSTTAAIMALGGQVNAAANPYADTVYNNFNSTNKLTNYGVSGQVDYQWGQVKLTGITAWRHSHADQNQDSDFTSLDILGENALDQSIDTFTQELRATTTLGKAVNLLFGAYYFNEHIRQTGELRYGTQMRPYADLLIQGATGGAENLAQVEQFVGAYGAGNPAAYVGQFFTPGSGLSEAYRLANESYSLFAQADIHLTRRLTLTGGINYTHDGKRFSTHVTSSDVFSGIDLAQVVGNALTAGVPAASAYPLLALRALQFMPPFLNLPNAAEPGRTNDNNVSFTARLAYDVSRHVNAYVSYATGFKASSVNLSRDSRPALADAAAIVGDGLGLANLRYGSRFAGPERSKVAEVGLKGNWGRASLNLAGFYEEIDGFQSNTFTGIGFDLENAEKESVWGLEVEGQARVARELVLSGSLTYLAPKYDRYTNSSFGDVSGATPAGIPPVSLTIAATEDHPLANGDHIVLRADWHYEAPYQVEDGLPGFITTNPLTGQVISYQSGIDAARPYRALVSEVDGSLAYRRHGGVELSVWTRNMFNHRTLIAVFDSPAQQGSVSGYTNQPRTFGVAAGWKF